MADKKFKDILENLLKTDSRLIDEHKELNLTVLRELADKTDEKLIELLLSNENVKNKFFLKKKDVLIFKQNDFKFYLDENKIDNSSSSRTVELLHEGQKQKCHRACTHNRKSH